VESPRKGLSDMDVARAAMGQGWPFAACPWSGDGMREPRRSRGRMVGCPSLWLLSLGQARESDSPVRGETHTARRRFNGECQVIDSEHFIASPVSTKHYPKMRRTKEKGKLRRWSQLPLSHYEPSIYSCTSITPSAFIVTWLVPASTSGVTLSLENAEAFMASMRIGGRTKPPLLRFRLTSL